MTQKYIQALCRDMIRVNGQLDKAERDIAQVKNDLLQNRNYSANLLSAISTIESEVLHLRSVANNCEAHGAVHKTMIDNAIRSQYRFSLNVQGNNVTRITTPCLLPHYDQRSKCIINEPFLEFLSQCDRDGKVIKYKSIVLAVINHVSEANSKNIRDNDNYEYKQIVNALALLFLEDDDFTHCKMLNATAASSADYTEIFLVPDEYFAEWYAKTGCSTMQKTA